MKQKNIIYVFPFTIWITAIFFFVAMWCGLFIETWDLEHISVCVNCIMYAKIVCQRLIALRLARKNFQTKDDDEGQKLIRCARQTRVYNTNINNNICKNTYKKPLPVLWTHRYSKVHGLKTLIVSVNLTSKRKRPLRIYIVIWYTELQWEVWNSM